MVSFLKATIGGKTKADLMTNSIGSQRVLVFLPGEILIGLDS